MSREQKRIVEVAESFVLSILDGKLNADNLSAKYEITSGNQKVLLKHLKAIHSIIGKAIEILGGKECTQIY